MVVSDCNNRNAINGTSSSTTRQFVVDKSRLVATALDQYSPLTVIIIIVGCLTLVGILVAIMRRKRRIDRWRNILLPIYTFDSNESDNWELELLQHEGLRTATV